MRIKLVVKVAVLVLVAVAVRIVEVAEQLQLKQFVVVVQDYPIWKVAVPVIVIVTISPVNMVFTFPVSAALACHVIVI